MKRALFSIFVIDFLLTLPLTALSHQYTLSNGMEVVLIESRETNLIGLSVMIHGGTQYEKGEERGTFQLLTEIISRGTEKRSKDDIVREISLIGDSFDLYTSQEYWGIRATIPPDSLKELLELVRDLLFEPLFQKGELARVKNIAIQSIRSAEDSPESRLFELYRSVFYPDFYIPGEKRIEHIQEIRNDTLMSIHRRFFRPDNMVITIAGNFETEIAKDLIRESFGTIPSPGVPFEKGNIEQKKTDLPLQSEEKGGLTQAGIIIGTRLEGFDRKKEPVIEVLNAVLSNSLGGRLYEEVREKGLTYSIRPYYSLRIRPYTWFIYGTSRKKNISRVIEETERTLKELPEHPPGEDELKLAKEYLKTRLAVSYQSPESQAVYSSRQLMRNEGIKSYLERIGEIEAVTQQDLISFIDIYFPDSWTILVLK